jgi:hypothetical protein
MPHDDGKFGFLIPTVFPLTHLPDPGTSKTGFGQVKIMKEFVLINSIIF